MKTPDIADLTDAELEGFEYHGCSSGTSTPPMVRDAIVRACAEIRRNRNAHTASATEGIPDVSTSDLDAIESKARADAERLDGRHGDPSKRGSWIGHRDHAVMVIALASELRSLRNELARLRATLSTPGTEDFTR